MAALRAIIWAAVSSEEQAKDDKTSLETQERDARQFADAQDLLIIDVLIVGGFSRRFFAYYDFVEAAALDGFYDPQRMIEHWKRRDFDVLIARDGSRFGREQVSLASLWRAPSTRARGCICSRKVGSTRPITGCTRQWAALAPQPRLTACATWREKPNSRMRQRD